MSAKRKDTQYTNESISALKGADRVRKRPGVIFGSDGLEGCQHSVFEILSNSVDEARLGYGDKIIVTKFLDHSVQIQDFGRGIPVDWNQNEEKYNWELIFCELYAGGKFEAEDYGYSLGLNGLGLCATQYASEYMDVEILREGQRYNLHFEHGEIVGEMQKQPVTTKKTGTTIKWKPDIQVFTDIKIPDEYYLETLRRQAVVNAGVTFLLRVEQPDGSFIEGDCVYEHGIVDYVKELAGEDTLTPIQFWQAERVGRDREDKPDYKVKLSVAFCFSNQKQLLEYSHNSSFLEHGGSPDRAVKVAFTGQIDTLLKQTGKYFKNENKITFQDVEDCLVLFSSSFSTVTSYANQTKKAISNKFIYEAMNEFLRYSLEVYFLENPEQAGKIAEQVLINKRSRENAEKTRLNLRKKLTGAVDVTSRVQKFVDCRSKDLAKREIYIVEGDSALGACKLGRDSEFQAIIPVRGKILNCLKAEYDKIFKNEIITDIIKVLGCGVEVRNKASKDLATFDFSNLRWNKVVICTDADVDGFQIRTLILTMLYRLTPTLIEQGCVYIAESPLYEITAGTKTYFAYSEAEKARCLAQLEGQKFTIQRSKGLGENEPDMMWLTTMNPETRRLIKVTPTDAAATAEMFDVLLGDNLAARKEFIATVGPDYLDVADVS
ncbi:MAG: toprim domain-containing protein [Oscillospiraceae bacterium]|nr:toprim domain-containing protein [Oscillospiraceae bacterium]